ncbi:hypothetical protein GGX14DRAFT_570270 [Mycena pura]|uniref:Uncharacterized protein n=1 Tax=Mycena pura TaxID=153505 RepID=A0AAD6VC91_9AGAR|nr:hypothetical protein GGX14DRAFT_570270 [Mycena pura]
MALLHGSSHGYRRYIGQQQDIPPLYGFHFSLMLNPRLRQIPRPPKLLTNSCRHPATVTRTFKTHTAPLISTIWDRWLTALAHRQPRSCLPPRVACPPPHARASSLCTSRQHAWHRTPPNASCAPHAAHLCVTQDPPPPPVAAARSGDRVAPPTPHPARVLAAQDPRSTRQPAILATSARHHPPATQHRTCITRRPQPVRARRPLAAHAPPPAAARCLMHARALIEARPSSPCRPPPAASFLPPAPTSPRPVPAACRSLLAAHRLRSRFPIFAACYPCQRRRRRPLHAPTSTNRARCPLAAWCAPPAARHARQPRAHGARVMNPQYACSMNPPPLAVRLLSSACSPSAAHLPLFAARCPLLALYVLPTPVRSARKGVTWRLSHRTNA